MGALLGIEIDSRSWTNSYNHTGSSPCIYWSGFSCHGDGACFEGSQGGKRCTWVYPHDMEQQGEMLSQCGVRSYFNVNDDVQDGFKFCPYCGKPIHVK